MIRMFLYQNLGMLQDNFKIYTYCMNPKVSFK